LTVHDENARDSITGERQNSLECRDFFDGVSHDCPTTDLILGEKRDAIGDAHTGETARQFAMFREYRDLHPLERSLAAVGRKLGVSTAYLERLSSLFGWVKRVRAFDQEEDRRTRALRIRRVEEMNEQHAQIAALVLQKVSERLNAMDVNSLRPSDVARLLDIGSKVQRNALGLADAVAPQEQERSQLPTADELRRMFKAAGIAKPIDPQFSHELLIPPAERNRQT
jgi:hypothetical protein